MILSAPAYSNTPYQINHSRAGRMNVSAPALSSSSNTRHIHDSLTPGLLHIPCCINMRSLSTTSRHRLVALSFQHGIVSQTHRSRHGVCHPNASSDYHLSHYRTVELFLPASLTRRCGGKVPPPLPSLKITFNKSTILLSKTKGSWYTIELVPLSYPRFHSNASNKIIMNKDIPRIVTDILENGATLAIVSRNSSKALYVSSPLDFLCEWSD